MATNNNFGLLRWQNLASTNTSQDVMWVFSTACVKKTHTTSCWWNHQGNSCSVLSLVLFSSFTVAMSLLVVCAQPLPFKFISFLFFMHELIVLTVCSVPLNLQEPCCRLVWFFIGFLFPGKWQTRSHTFQIFNLKAPKAPSYNLNSTYFAVSQNILSHVTLKE